MVYITIVQYDFGTIKYFDFCSLCFYFNILLLFGKIEHFKSLKLKTNVALLIQTELFDKQYNTKKKLSAI